MKRIILAASAVLTLAASCQVNYDKTASGLVYKVIPGKGGEKLQPGNFVKLNISFLLPEKKDSVLSTTFGKLPGYIPVDTGARSKYTFMEVLSKCNVGDSGVVVLSIDSLKNRNAIEYNETFVKGGTLQCRFRVLQAFKKEDEVMADYQKEMEVENKREIKAVEDYMTQKGFKGVKTKNGVYVTIENAGDQSMKADSGKIASIKYKGYLQSNGKVFDTNLDTSKGHSDPISVPVGKRSVIQGWEEALPYFGKGGSGKIFVPAFLGYGAQGAPPDIAPYSNLVFDIQVLDVKEAPASTNEQRMPNMPPQGH